MRQIKQEDEVKHLQATCQEKTEKVGIKAP